jgi:tetratricopeptide (TPR) repeat protein
VAQLHLGLLCLRQGRLGAAKSQLERCLALSERLELPQVTPQAGALLGAAYVLDGRPAEGVPLLEQAAARLDFKGARPDTRLSFVTEGYLLAGRFEDANPLAGPALEAARLCNEPGHQALALHLLGEIAARRDPPDIDEAEARCREALALAEEMGMRPLEAHCHLGLGKLYRGTGRLEEARAELATGVEMLRSMDMTFWLPEAEAEMRAMAASPAG